MVGGFFIAVCVALYAYEYGNLPETAISVKWLFATCAGHILISKAGNVDGCCKRPNSLLFIHRRIHHYTVIRR